MMLGVCCVVCRRTLLQALSGVFLAVHGLQGDTAGGHTRRKERRHANTRTHTHTHTQKRQCTVMVAGECGCMYVSLPVLSLCGSMLAHPWMRTFMFIWMCHLVSATLAGDLVAVAPWMTSASPGSLSLSLCVCVVVLCASFAVVVPCPTTPDLHLSPRAVHGHILVDPSALGVHMRLCVSGSMWLFA